MNETDTAKLLQIRRDLTGGTYNDDTIAVWCEALKDWPLTECKTALIDAARGNQRVTVAHLVERLPAPARKRSERALQPVCIRCNMAPAALLRTRCEPCAQIVHDQIRDGAIHSPAMADAVQAARRRRDP